MSAEPHPVEVPRVPQARRTRSLALRGVLLVPFAGAAAFVAVWLFVAGSALLAFVVPFLVAGLPFGSYLQVRGNAVREVRWDGAVLAGRTALGWQGVELARVRAVEVGLGKDDVVLQLGLADDAGHLEVQWALLTATPGADEVRAALLDRQRHGVVLPTALCRAWGEEPVAGATDRGAIPPELRPAPDRAVDRAVTAASLVAAAVGVVLAFVV
ncbi:hypothetical protein [Blastococcus sp. TF02A-26]|uniref:hypothetical protein n=1 Tax=Blastococcus sp. TF02A-26 TaxID=2250577 RepID=UPI000DEA589C|nr:hypothetical protein [Blastococcus sp. TF02A-26]RBY84751.1 hypothetical protein DQ240_14070 [Blastococcus sp. TF02A-26]